MQILITHAKPTGPQCQQVLPKLQLPNLSALLRLLTPAARQTGEEDSLSPLHELLEAQALGIQAPDGLLPWAALQAHRRQLPCPDAEAWAWLTPCHWQVNADHVRMADPLDTQISAEESHAVMDALRPYLLEDGISLNDLLGGNWLARGRVFDGLPTASLARASGGAVDHWMPRQAQAKALRRLQNEMQMLLYSHPVNDARAARGLLPINSFWVSGTGRLPAGFSTIQDSCVLDALRDATLRDDARAWQATWQALDGAEIKAALEQVRRGETLELTLCGETAAQRFAPQAQGLWTRLSNRFASTDIPALLQGL